VKSSTLHDEFAATSRPSALRALAWKEWRQQRWVLLILAPMPVLTFAVLVTLSGFMAHAAAVILFFGVPVVLGANAFCAESDEGITEFRDRLPVRERTLFLLKAGVALVAVFIVLAALVASMVLSAWAKGDPAKAWSMLREPLPMWLAVTWIATLTPAVMTVVARRTVSCILASVLALASTGVLLWLLYQDWEFLRVLARGRLFILHASATLLIGVVLTLILGWRYWSWGRMARPLAGRALRIAVLPLIVLVVILGPPLAHWIYAIFLAPLPRFLKGEDGYHAVADGASPDGRWITIYCWWPGWKNTGREALVNAETGDWRWLSRLRASSVHAYGYPHRCGAWDSASRRFVLVHHESWLWPFEVPSPAWWLWGRGRKHLRNDFAIIRPEGGRRESLFALCPELKAAETEYLLFLGWVRNDVVAFAETRAKGTVWFADLAAGSALRCALGGSAAEYEVRSFPRWLMARGVLGARYSEKAGALIVCLFAPDQAEARLVRIPVGEKDAFLTRVSPDGRWCLIAASADGERRTYLASLETGEAVLIYGYRQSDWPTAGDQKTPFRFTRFTPDSRCVLRHDNTELALWDIERRAVTRRVTVAPGPTEAVNGAIFSPSGRFVLLAITEHEGGVDRPSRTLSWRVADMETGKVRDLLSVRRPPGPWPNAGWLGEERLFCHVGSELWVMRPDGTERRCILSAGKQENVSWGD